MGIVTGIGENTTQNNSNKINLSQCLVYIAENDISSFLLLEELLQSTGIKLKHAVNGKELLNLINSKTPDLVLLDINMPVMNGFETIDKIREAHPTIPIYYTNGIRYVRRKREVYLCWM